MPNYQRFQTISAGAQNRFDPDSPVWVSRYRLSLDAESGKRLLQVRMVNLSDKRLRQVFLRIRCIEAETRKVTTLEMIPLPAVLVLPGRAFGDDKIVEITPPDISFVEAFVQRVVFSDGTTWNEESPHNYLAFAAPVPVKTDDPDYRLYRERAEQGGVRNSYYFHSQKGVWTCTCGQPNGTASLRCAHCGADRLWLEKNMDPEYLEPAPVQPPVQNPAPAQSAMPMVVPFMTAPPAPYPDYPLYPDTRPVPQPEEDEDDSDEEDQTSHAGRTLAIALAAVLALCIAVFCVFKFLMPYLRYRNALTAQSAGDYQTAVAIFEDLGDYKDSADRINQIALQKVRAAMSAQDYAGALQLLEPIRSLEGAEALRADCIYSLGVLAFNDGDLDRAQAYVDQLAAEYPEYDGLPTLRQYCSYSLGNRRAGEAAELTDPNERIQAYEDAISRFTEAGDYSDSADRILECRFRIGVEQMNAEQFPAAIDTFTQLGDYKQSREYRSDCMFRYAQTHLDGTDQTAIDYLETLSAEGYEGAQELLDRLNGIGFRFNLSLSAAASDAEVSVVANLSSLYIHYEVARSSGSAVLILARYTMPDGRQGRAILNSDGSASGMKPWAAIFPTDCSTSGYVRVEFFDSERGEVEPLQAISFEYRYQQSSQPDSGNGLTING